ncbi:glycosyltransferase [Acetobacterium woodii]|uniref:Glycosyltransferase n=1 Tax=Acetobacterium woodii (strain ATCC 29683 / DSM 1030 / JCM 2381 / KCTC 1655 / WB1) TaxID=931626 RepID=H6LIR5_ACEWD|nr:glycosyltransferase [Acetobacterium woodii]AFA49804.1 glycosyltransferase [Acetobacterium woodii DSM 1030]
MTEKRTNQSIAFDKEKNFVSAVIYVYNDEERIGEFLQKINTVLRTNFENYQIICVNDASEDNSLAVIREIGKTITGTVINVVNMSFYQGVELSMNAGIDLSIGDFVFEFDNLVMDYGADLMMEVYNRCLSGFDIVNAAPKKCGHKSSRLFYRVFNRYSHNPHPLRTENFRILSRRAINRVHSVSRTIPYRKAVYANCGLKIATIVYNNDLSCLKAYGKETRYQRKEMAADSLILFTNVAYKMTILAAVFMMIATFGIGIYTLFSYVFEDVVSGYTSMMLVIVFGFFGVFVILAVIIKYLSMLMELVFSKQKYTIESVETLSE